MSGRRNGWSTLPIHPVLLALAFPLFLLATNADQWVDLSAAWAPIGLSLAAGTALLAVCAWLFGGWQRGSLVASLLVILFFSFGHVRLALSGSGIEADLALVWLGLALAGLTFIERGARHLGLATRALNAIALLLVVFNLASVGTYLVSQAGQSIGQDPAAMSIPAVDRRPDIYYLVFDRYAGGETLDQLYGFDNGDFLGELEQHGFVVAREAWANYGGTALSLVSSLSLDYLDGAVLGQTRPATYGPIHAALRGHLTVPDTLTDIGYEYVHIGNWWEPGTTNVDADRVLVYRRESEFATALLETTALTLVAGLGPPSGDPEVLQIGSANRAHTLYEFEQVESAASLSGPTFVFAHFLVPHPPYVFNADGSAPNAEEAAARAPREAYLEQLQWTNGRILELVDVLLDVPAGEEPIIIIQADEGPYPPRYEANQDGFRWLEATAAEVQEKFGVLNALFLPGVDPEELGFDDRTGPVNNFRLVFNAYFGTDLPLLEDRTYLSPDKSHLYEFTRYPRPD